MGSYAERPTFERALRRTFGDVRVEEFIFRNRLLGDKEANWLYFEWVVAAPLSYT